MIGTVLCMRRRLSSKPVFLFVNGARPWSGLFWHGLPISMFCHSDQPLCLRNGKKTLVLATFVKQEAKEKRKKERRLKKQKMR